MSKMTDEEKQEVVARYLEEMEQFESDEEKAQNSVEVVKQLAEEFEGKTTNSIRMTLMGANVYIKKLNKASTSSGSGGATKRVSKADAQQELRNAIVTIDPDLLDDEIIDKLTGKAAQYLAGVVVQAISVGE